MKTTDFLLFCGNMGIIVYFFFAQSMLIGLLLAAAFAVAYAVNSNIEGKKKK